MFKEETTLHFEIINQIGIISEDGKWRLELNRISWNGREPKYDLRRWTSDHEKMGKGITLTDAELLELCNVLVQEKEFLSKEQK